MNRPAVRTYTKVSTKVLEAIFEELRLLREELMLLFPQEDLEEYSDPARIKRSYQNAIKEHPPVISLWK